MKSIYLFGFVFLVLACGQPSQSDQADSQETDQENYAEPKSDDSEEVEADIEGPVVYVTHDGDKYHTADCRYSKTAHAVKLSQARADGKTACSICKPNSKTGEKQMRCSGTTAEGKRCQRLTTDPGGRCFQHREQ